MCHGTLKWQESPRSDVLPALPRPRCPPSWRKLRLPHQLLQPVALNLVISRCPPASAGFLWAARHRRIALSSHAGGDTRVAMYVSARVGCVRGGRAGELVGPLQRARVAIDCNSKAVTYCKHVLRARKSERQRGILDLKSIYDSCPALSRSADEGFATAAPSPRCMHSACAACAVAGCSEDRDGRSSPAKRDQ